MFGYLSNEFPIQKSLKHGTAVQFCFRIGHLEGSSKPGGVEMD